jgi:L-aminopeptidase/D-esterase-like protein
MNGTLTDVTGIQVGHYTDLEHGTGVTVVIAEAGAVGGVDVCGTATGSRELLTLDPQHSAKVVHGLCLAGGSAFGLAAADGVMKYLEERGIGYQTSVALVPIVPAAIIFDLGFKDHRVRPDAAMGYRACGNASAGPVEEGSVGVGTGATVGKLLGPALAMKSGVGSASRVAGTGVVIGALAVVNNFGDVLDRKTGKIMAGCRDPKTGQFLDVARLLSEIKELPEALIQRGTNLVVVATDAQLTKPQASKVARMATAGMDRTLSPAHATFDGDVTFCLSTGLKPGEVNQIGVLAAEAVAEAINRAVEQADGLGVLPAFKDFGF